MNEFLSLLEDINITNGKYSSKRNTFFEELNQFRKNKIIDQYHIKPITFTFEITTKCNGFCEHCGMNSNNVPGKQKLTKDELFYIVDELQRCGIISYEVTGGEPFLEFHSICEMLSYSKNKIDFLKITSNGFWGQNPEYYFTKLIECGFFENKYLIPGIVISIGEQKIPLESICHLIHYIQNYSKKDFSFSILNTRHKNEEISQIEKLVNLYHNTYGEIPKNRIYLKDGYYCGTKDKIKIPLKEAICYCDNRFEDNITKFLGPRILMKCNGDCYPCCIFNIHKDFYLGNFFNDGLEIILENYNENKYVNFIHDYGVDKFKYLIPKDELTNNFSENSCEACEWCIHYCSEHKLL